MAKLEAQIVALKSDIDRFKKKNKSLREQLALADEVVEAAKDCNVWGGKQAEKLRDTIARYDEGRKR